MIRRHPVPGSGDRGASVVEYGLIAGGVVVAFLVAFIGLQALVGEVFGRAVSSVEHVDPVVPLRTTPLASPS